MLLRYAYLHGFASSPNAHKATQLAPAFAKIGIRLERPDLNVPSFEQMTYTAILEALDTLHRRGPKAKWCLIGSSMGGYMAARFAAEYPERVHRLILLCPGFLLVDRWPSVFGEQAFAAWEQAGTLPVPDATGQAKPLHWGFIEDARTHPGRPSVPCPTKIVHGRGDEVVPVESSREYVIDHPEVMLHEVDDDHGLVASIPTIRELAMEAWFVGGAKRFRYHWDFFGPDREQTGEHFRGHLDEFLARESLDHLGLTGTGQARSDHFGVYLDAPEALEELLRRALSPNRKTIVPD